MDARAPPALDDLSSHADVSIDKSIDQQGGGLAKRITRLKDAIQRSAYTQQQLADMLGIKKGTMSAYVTGRSKVPRKLLDAMEKLLGEPLWMFDAAERRPDGSYLLSPPGSSRPRDYPLRSEIEHPFVWLMVQVLALSLGCAPSKLWARVEGVEPMPGSMIADLARVMGVPQTKIRATLSECARIRLAQMDELELEFQSMQGLRVDPTKVRDAIESRGLMQKWVCENIGVPTTTFHAYLTGRARMPAVVLQSLADLLKIDWKSLTVLEDKAVESPKQTKAPARKRKARAASSA